MTFISKTNRRGTMKYLISLVFVALIFAQNAAGELSPQGAPQKSTMAGFSFGTVKYFHRYTTADQHEFTPAGQEDLKAWTDMVTVLFYRNVRDGEGLAATASAVLENYKANRAVVVRTDSVPRTAAKPAEHLAVVTFGRPEFIEAVFARFKISDGIGTAVIYSHRIYGNKVGDSMSAWLKANGPATEKTLMTWDAMPKLPPR